MCLITDQLKPTILNEDLIVYKALQYGCYSPYKGYAYTLDVLYEMEDVGIINIFNAEIYDDLASEGLCNKFNVGLWREIDDDKLSCVANGYHAALTPERLLEERYNCDIYKCIYPKGSIIYSDPSGLCVSNKIIITNEKVLEQMKRY